MTEPFVFPLQETVARSEDGLDRRELEELLKRVADACPKPMSRVLLIVPDFTRFHSNAGAIANILYRRFTSDGAKVDLLEALGSHLPVPDAELDEMYGDIPHERFIPHDWRKDTVNIGEVPASYVTSVSEGLVAQPIPVEVNRRLFDGYDRIFSIGQVVPHEVVGMANGAKNIFVGCGGAAMIGASHHLGAFWGLERIMGVADTPVRRVFHYAAEQFLGSLPIVYILTVTTAPGGAIRTHGVFAGSTFEGFDKAAVLAQKKNLTMLDKPLETVVVYLDEREFRSAWVGNKSIYRTRKAIADGGRLIVLAPGVAMFGEDPDHDRLIRKYGYCGRENLIRLIGEQEDLQNNLSAAAHLIQGSSDGRFSITYCTRDDRMSERDIRKAGFDWMSWEEASAIYDPSKLQPGYNRLNGGTDIFYVPNPALGLWALKEQFPDLA